MVLIVPNKTMLIDIEVAMKTHIHFSKKLTAIWELLLEAYSE